MIFAELQYDQHYSELHSPLVDFLATRFEKIEHGLQGDSWIWIYENDSSDDKVAIDTFSAMKHQIKSAFSNKALAFRVIELLSSQFQIDVLQEPVPEPHEETQLEQDQIVFREPT